MLLCTYNDGTNVKCEDEQENVDQQVDGATSSEQNGDRWQEDGQNDQENFRNVSHLAYRTVRAFDPCDVVVVFRLFCEASL